MDEPVGQMKKAIPPAVHDHGGTAFYLFHFDHMQHVGHILLIPAAVGSRVACGEDGKLAFFYKAFAFYSLHGTCQDILDRKSVV